MWGKSSTVSSFPSHTCARATTPFSKKMDTSSTSNRKKKEGYSIKPVVFLSLDSLPDCRKQSPEEELKFAHFTMAYFVPVSFGNGYYEFQNPDKPDQTITLYPSAVRTLAKNLDLAVTATKSIKANPELLIGENLWKVCTVNDYNGMTTSLVVSTFGGEVYIYLKLFTTNAEGDTYPTRKSVRFTEEEAANKFRIEEFIEGKR